MSNDSKKLKIIWRQITETATMVLGSCRVCHPLVAPWSKTPRSNAPPPGQKPPFGYLDNTIVDESFVCVNDKTTNSKALTYLLTHPSMWNAI